jgi:formate dehydrogenase major subunit
MAEVTLNINGIDVTADDSRTILQVVREKGLDDIPALCYEERLGHITSCFLCVVEVEGARTLVPSCSTKVARGMVVRTNSDTVKEARKTCLELLFSDHYADCISPCAQECPAGVDIQGYLSLVRRGLYREAVELIKERNPMPIVCGRVCVRKCEVGCRRNILDEPVGINFLKRYAAETAEGRLFRPEVKPSRGKSVAVVGGGPAGLSAAYYLAVEGYRVTLFEAMPEAGGMLRYGIPAYRLPKELLDQEIDSIRSLGVEIHCNRQIGRDFVLTDLRQQHDAVLIAMGAWGAMKMRVENEEAPGVLSGLDVLRQVAEGSLKELKGRVLVIGGGNTAIDASRTSVRLGADETVIIYRRTEAEMPAHHEEISAAKEEGVVLKFLVAPTRVITDGTGRLTGLECQKMELGPPDASGRPRPVPVQGSEYVEPCDWILAAIGQSTDLKCLESGGSGCSLQLNRWGTVEVNRETMETSIPGVFSAGDVVTGAATVIEGIAGGRRAAYAIHGTLSGEAAPLEVKGFTVRKDMFAPLTPEDLAAFGHSPRHVMPERDASRRVGDFKEVELGLSRQETVEESGRCFECGCLEVDTCLLREYGEAYGVNPARFLGEVNRYQVDRRHPFVMIDPNKCIKCGRCIRTCENVLGASALGFIRRGFATIIAPAMEKPLKETGCISCGNCIDSCPTGALSENQPLLARIGDRVEDHPAVCSFCSVGCGVNVKTFGRDMRIRSTRDRFTGLGDYLCRRGRFGSRYLNAEDRILQPAIRKDGRTNYTGWKESLEAAAAGLIRVREKHGPGSIGVFISPKLTCEEIYGAVRLARGVLGTDVIGSYRDLFHGRSHHELDATLGHTVSTCTMDDLQEADVILLFNADPLESHPSFGWKIREAQKRGVRVIVISSSRTEPVRYASLWLQPRRGTGTRVLSAMMREMVENGTIDCEFIRQRVEGFEGFKEFLSGFPAATVSPVAGVMAEKIRGGADILSRGNPRVVAVYDFDNPLDRAAGDLQALASLLLLTGNVGRKGSGLLLLQKHCNTTGLYDMGGEPGYLPGRRPITDAQARTEVERAWNTVLPAGPAADGLGIPDLFLSGKIKAALVIGEDPLENPGEVKYFRKLEFLAVADLFTTETTAWADVILPASTAVESGGSYTGLDRKVQAFPPAFPPPGGLTTLQILSGLSAALEKPMGLGDPPSVFREMQKVNPLYAPIGPAGGITRWSAGSAAGEGIMYTQSFALPGGRAVLSPYPLDMTPFPADDFTGSSIESRYRDWVSRLFLKGSLIPMAV